MGVRRRSGETDAKRRYRLGKKPLSAAHITTRPTKVRVRVNGRIHPAVAKKVNGRVKIFVTPKVAAKIPTRFKKNPAPRIVPITKERYERDVKRLLRSPYNMLPFAIFKRTKGKGVYLLYRGNELIKAGGRAMLKRYAKREVAT